jgi:hypothetical protein
VFQLSYPWLHIFWLQKHFKQISSFLLPTMLHQILRSLVRILSFDIINLYTKYYNWHKIYDSPVSMHLHKYFKQPSLRISIYHAQSK